MSHLESKHAKSVFINFWEEKIKMKIVNVLMWMKAVEIDILIDLVGFESNPFVSR